MIGSLKDLEQGTKLWFVDQMFRVSSTELEGTELDSMICYLDKDDKLVHLCEHPEIDRINERMIVLSRLSLLTTLCKQPVTIAMIGPEGCDFDVSDLDDDTSHETIDLDGRKFKFFLSKDGAVKFANEHVDSMLSDLQDVTDRLLDTRTANSKL